MKDLSAGMITIERRELELIAQMVHQAYHSGLWGEAASATWRDCSVGVCGRIRSLLDEPMFSWETPPPAPRPEPAEPCPHFSATGEDQSSDGPEKIWICDECGVRFRFVRGSDGFDHKEFPAPRPAGGEG